MLRQVAQHMLPLGTKMLVVAAIFLFVCCQLCWADEYKEFDTTEREADVYLFTRPVNEKFPNDVEYHHWALVFRFEGEDIRTVEAFQDEGSMLTPGYTKERPREQGTYYFLGKVIRSPLQVLEMTRNNNYNYMEYSLTWQNCQTWVKEIAATLGEVIKRKIEDFKSLKEARPVFAFAAKTASSFSGTSMPVSDSGDFQCPVTERDVTQSVYTMTELLLSYLYLKPTSEKTVLLDYFRLKY